MELQCGTEYLKVQIRKMSTMSDPLDEIRSALISGCSEEEFLAMQCPACSSALVPRETPDGKGFFVRCKKDSTHLGMHGETETPPDWWAKKSEALGWY